MSQLALLGGDKAVKDSYDEVFAWPIIDDRIRRNVEAVVEGRLAVGEFARRFESGFAAWHGVDYALAHNNGTASLHSAMFGVGVGVGDEIIAPAITYWASCLPALSLGAQVRFADIDPNTLCIDPVDLERRITPRTKAVVAVHYLGMPCDMDAIMGIARRRGLKVVEDVSHAHGTLYKGRIVGSIGDAAGFSLMGGKAFAVGEGGMMLTNDRGVYERALLFGHYERHKEIENERFKPAVSLPWGGYKYRINPFAAAVGCAQLEKYPAEMAEIQEAMNYFWDLLEGAPGIKPHRPPKGDGSTMGGWYMAHGLYDSTELDGLSLSRFSEAVNAEGGKASPGCNFALQQHPIFSTVDVYGHGKPTQLANQAAGSVELGSFPVAEGIQERTFYVPWFKQFRKDVIEQHAEAFLKVVAKRGALLAGDKKIKIQGFAGLSGMASK